MNVKRKPEQLWLGDEFLPHCLQCRGGLDRSGKLCHSCLRENRSRKAGSRRPILFWNFDPHPVDE